MMVKLCDYNTNIIYKYGEAHLLVQVLNIISGYHLMKAHAPLTSLISAKRGKLARKNGYGNSRLRNTLHFALKNKK